MTGAPRIGLVGCGAWGRFILRDLVSLGCAVEVVATTEASRANARAFGAAAVHPSADRLPPVDGLVVASPSSTHAEVVLRLLDRGVPVFVEKPLTVDVASAERIAREAGDRVFVMDKWRYHPGVLALGAVARSGELGPVLGMRTVRAQWGCPHADADCTWILAPHDLSIFREVVGPLPPPRQAWAEPGDGGALGLVGVLGTDPWLVLEVSARHPIHRREVRLHCRDGIAVLDDAYATEIAILRGPGPGAAGPGEPAPERRPFSGEAPLLAELRAFADHLRGGPPPKSSAAEGAAAVRAIADLRRLAGLDRP